MRNAKRIAGVTVLLAVVASIAAYPFLPDMVAAHWNSQGNPDQFRSRLSEVVTWPAIMAFFIMFASLRPGYERLLFARYRPSEAESEAVLPVYVTTVLLLALVILAFHLLNLALDLGFATHTAAERGSAVILSLTAIVVGNITPRMMRRNAFAGLRFPWVFVSDSVWRRTQRAAGYCIVLVGFAGLAGALLGPPDHPERMLMRSMLVYIIGIAVYSFIISRRATAAQPTA
ncbi:MAG: DUF1648 domain-containing protein [Gemmatimonadaceae bacterium]